MNVARMLTRSVVIATPVGGAVDAYGDASVGTPISQTVDAYVEQTSTTERTDGQQTASGQWWAAVPVGTSVAATSSLTIVDSGQVFQVTGEPATRWNPRLRRNEFIRLELTTDTA